MDKEVTAGTSMKSLHDVVPLAHLLLSFKWPRSRVFNYQVLHLKNKVKHELLWEVLSSGSQIDVAYELIKCGIRFLAVILHEQLFLFHDPAVISGCTAANSICDMQYIK